MTFIRPGQRIIVAYSRTLDQQEIADIRATIVEHLPGVEPLILGGCTPIVYTPAPHQEQAVTKGTPE
jgi:hypothetical protein